MPNSNPTLTSANADITLAIPGIFTSPQQILGFSADNIYEIINQINIKKSMGVDGHSLNWFVYKPIEQTFTLLPDSPSNEIFETWAAQERTNHDLYVANGSALLTSAGEKYIMTRGYMTKRQPGKYTITWQSVKATAI